MIKTIIIVTVIGYECIWGLFGTISSGGGGEGKDTESEEDQVCYIHTYHESTMKPTTMGGGRNRKYNGNTMEGVRIFKAHCTHVRKYHNGILCIINV
jgi:hypothetical protein